MDGGSTLTRRSLLGAAAAGVLVSGCSSSPAAKPGPPRPPDPETLLLRSLIADKERTVDLYRRAALSQPRSATALQPFAQRHLAHLAAMRRMLPQGAEASALAPSASAATSATAAPSPSPSASTGVSLAELRGAERRAAAARPGQMAGASPALSQLLASVGACEAVHVIALGRLR
ncbi:hypothetical protein [Microtetraspora sp. NBRC 16547]|uniref:hypothetical protein n=1 Tax=Microtetraspora sp. NBRC 16547 TaxID=3030993 RepID=UPI0024A0209C|nr:hypothetical protein [Microtetraspora sp. NBRC 16547]GLW98026.1 hypothetical protein Misp02_21130 [Microtetraspora sp. NBRC 16547]